MGFEMSDEMNLQLRAYRLIPPHPCPLPWGEGGTLAHFFLLADRGLNPVFGNIF
jgi:hypothetical protein